VAKLSSITRLALFTLAIGTSLLAQSPWSTGFKMGGGPTASGVKSLLGDAGYSMGGAFELGYQLDKNSSLVFDAGYRFYPGDFKTVSYIPATASTVAGTYEGRVRKPEAKGFEFTALYRRDLFEDVYAQGGIRLGLNKVTFTDTGSSVTYAGTPVTRTQVVTIASMTDKKTTSFGLMAGLGYRFGSAFTMEFNAFTVRLGDPLGDTRTGVATELTFGIRF
jgi:opacity protein-like surface antigen